MTKKKRSKKIAFTKNPKKPIYKPLWTLDQGITYSGLDTFESCPEQFAAQYMDGWTSKKISVPLEFGSIMHYAIEHQFNFSSPEETIAQISDQYRKFRLPSLLNNSEIDTLETLLAMAEATFPAYCYYWDEDDKNTKWIVREGKFSVPYDLPMPEGVRKITLRGMRDGIYRTARQGVLGIFETKNKSRISENEIRDGLRADMQTLFYATATYIEKGECPRQVLYNIIRRSDLYRRSKGQEPLNEYIGRLKDDIKARPDHYFKRFSVDLLPSDIENFINKTLNPLLIRFVHWYDSVKKNPSPRGRHQSPHHYLSLKNLIGKYGKVQLWEILVNNNTRGFRRRTETFSELEDCFQVTLWTTFTTTIERNQWPK